MADIKMVDARLDRVHADALSINSGMAAKQGILRLAEAAGCEERLDDGSHSEERFWFVVRALCADCGHDFEEMVRHGRSFAAQF